MVRALGANGISRQSRLWYILSGTLGHYPAMEQSSELVGLAIDPSPFPEDDRAMPETGLGRSAAIEAVVIAALAG